MGTADRINQDRINQERATRSAERMLATDRASTGAGIRLEQVGPGSAVMTLKVAEKHLNGHGICHGAYVFMLADTAFAVACNSYNQFALSQMGFISHLRPTNPGETLTAVAKEVNRSKRSGLYDVSVRTDDGSLIAEFRGHSRVIPGQHFEES